MRHDRLKPVPHGESDVAELGNYWGQNAPFRGRERHGRPKLVPHGESGVAELGNDWDQSAPFRGRERIS